MENNNVKRDRPLRLEETQKCTESRNQVRNSIKGKGWPITAGNARNSKRLGITFEFINMEMVVNFGDPELVRWLVRNPPKLVFREVGE